MTITLCTALPELYNDLCEVIRLFYGECEIHEDADGEICIVHTVEDEKHVVRVEKRRKTAPLTPVGEDELENQASVQARGEEHRLCRAQGADRQAHSLGKPDRHPPDTAVLRAACGRAG